MPPSSASTHPYHHSVDHLKGNQACSRGRAELPCLGKQLGVVVGGLSGFYWLHGGFRTVTNPRGIYLAVCCPSQ